MPGLIATANAAQNALWLGLLVIVAANVLLPAAGNGLVKSAPSNWFDGRGEAESNNVVPALPVRPAIVVPSKNPRATDISPIQLVTVDITLVFILVVAAGPTAVPGPTALSDGFAVCKKLIILLLIKLIFR